MPLKAYFKGDGEEVMRSMVKRYGPKKGKQMFYATAHAKGMTPDHKTALRRKARK